MAQYRVGYINEEGKKKAFYFESDKSFKTYGRSYSQGILGLGNPFVDDMYDAMVEKYGKAISYTRIKMIKCMDTGEVKFY